MLSRVLRQRGCFANVLHDMSCSVNWLLHKKPELAKAVRNSHALIVTFNLALTQNSVHPESSTVIYNPHP